MGGKRLTNGNSTVAEAQVAARREWVLRILAEPERSRARTEQMQAAMVALGLRKSQLYQIIERYQAQGRDGLVKPPRSDAGTARLGEDTRELWIAWATDPRRAHQTVTVRAEGFAKLHRRAEDQTFPSLNTLRRWLGEVDPALLMTKREVRRERRRTVTMAAAYPNHQWQADQRQADLFVVERQVDQVTGEILSSRTYRPLLFSFVDRHSGAVMGARYYEGNHQSYSTEVVEATLIEAIYPAPEVGLPLSGVPETIYWDNGAAHTSHWMRQVSHALGIELHFSVPGEPQSHGYIEGYHHVLKDRFEALQRGFCGGDNRPEERPLQMRLIDDGELPPQDLLTLGELNGAFAAWLPEFHERPYLDGPSRLTRWLRDVSPERRAVPEPVKLGWEFMQRDQRMVRGGRFDHRGIEYTGSGLGDLDGCRVEIRFLRADFRRVYVVLQGQLYAVAEPVEPRLYYSAESYQEVAEARRELRETNRRIDEVKRVLAASAAEGLVDEATARQGEQALTTARRELRPAVAARMRERIHQLSERHAGDPDHNVVRLFPRPETRPLPAEERPRRSAAELLAEVPDAPAPRRRAGIDDYL